VRRVYASGAFDGARSDQVRFLQEASRLGPLTLVLWPDSAIAASSGSPPRMSLPERVYYFEALGYVDEVRVGAERVDPDRLPMPLEPRPGEEPAIWAIGQAAEDGAPDSGARPSASMARFAWCRSRGIELREISPPSLAGFPYEAPPIEDRPAPGTKRVVVTGCYDWLHTGHLRFFEEASSYGELNVVIGSDANVRLLKGEGHPLFSETERSYMVGSFRCVARCLVSSGEGWLDAEPEIRALGAERYIVNEDGDKGEKRRYCEENGIEYIVLKRRPKEGLPRRSSTDLRGY
jgi:cytidyltransferase-like protein